MRYEIKNGKNKTYYFKNELKEFGCQFKKTGKYSGYWYLNTDDQFLANRLQAYCFKKRTDFFDIGILIFKKCSLSCRFFC